MSTKTPTPHIPAQMPESLQHLFHDARINPKHAMNKAGHAMGKHIVARVERAKAKRRKGRVVKGLRRKVGRATFNLG